MLRSAIVTVIGPTRGMNTDARAWMSSWKFLSVEKFTHSAPCLISSALSQIARSEESTKTDGRFELVSYYEREAITRQEERTSCVDRADVWIHYRDGEKVRQEEDHDCDGRADVRFVFEGGKLARKEALSR